MNGRIMQLCLITCAFSICAASTTFQDRTSFLGAISVLPGTQQSFSFEDYTYGKNSIREWGPSLTISNVTFSGSYLATLHYQELGPEAVLLNFEGGAPLALNFDHPVTAFGADYSSQIGHLFSSFAATLTLDSGEEFTFESSTNPDSTFFGFITGEPIRSLTFSDGGIEPIGGYFFHEELIKNIAMVMEVPEPSSAVLAVLGILGMLVRRRGFRAPARRHRSA